MENSVHQTDISCKMFEFLCNVIGSEKTVKARRLFFKIYQDVFSHRQITVIASGSKAEGLNMEGSDFDMMIILNTIPVYHDQSQIDSTTGLITDTENAAPGFVLIKLPQDNTRNPFLTKTEFGVLLSSEAFKQIILNFMQDGHDTSSILKLHGPCISSTDNEIDILFCLKSQTWPAVCMKWFHRPRYSAWPSSNDVTKIATEGLLYVPIGSKFGSKNENSLEWRISFSVPEKILVHSFNQTQLMCYALLKITLKEVINTKSHLKNLLCSYFMKTVVFWLAEESDPSSWNQETLFTCFQSCLDRLIYWVRIGYCPNYFMPQNNMFDGKIVGESQRNLLEFMTSLRNEGFQFINRSVTLSKFLSYDKSRSHIRCTEEEDIAIYPLLRYLLMPHSKYSILTRKHKLVQRICGHHVKGGRLAKYLYLLYLMYDYYNRTQTIPYSLHISNKRIYPSYKLLLFHCLIGKTINVVSGGALLAAFFYTHKEYEKVLSVTNYALQECTPDKYLVHPFNSLDLCNFEGIGNKKCNISFLQRHKLSCIYVCYICTPMPHSVFQIEDLTFEKKTSNLLKCSNFINLSFLPPNILIHYLRFMCFHHLGNCAERNRCFKDIKLTLEEGFLIANGHMRMQGVYCFQKAARIANCLKECEQEEAKALMEMLNFFKSTV